MPVTDINALIKRYQDELATALTRALLAEQAVVELQALVDASSIDESPTPEEIP